MNQEAKAKWLEALRSGRYRQGRDMLRSGRDEFCSLGVLCDISGLGSWGEGDPGDAESGGGDYRPYLGYATGLPPQVAEWAGVDPNPRAGDQSLVDLNDSRRLPFAEIADLIEADL